MCSYFFFFKQKTAYEMRISDWSSDVCSSDLCLRRQPRILPFSCRVSPASHQSWSVLQQSGQDNRCPQWSGNPDHAYTGFGQGNFFPHYFQTSPEDRKSVV